MIAPQAPTPLPLLITLAAATLAASLGISIASVLLPSLTQHFSASVSQVQWVVLAYLVSVTVTIVSAGRMGDLFGHRRVLASGLMVFVGASLLCAMAPDLWLLIAGRALQGVGGAILIALPMSMARTLVATDRLGMAMGVLGTTSALGTALGPSLGGVLLVWGDWRAAFWALAVCGLGAWVLCVICVPRLRHQTKATAAALDLPGTAVLVIALMAYALATSGGLAGTALSPAALFGAAVIGVAMFVLVERRAIAPLVPMTLLRDRRTGLGFVMNVLVGAVMMATLVVGPFYLVFALGMNAALVGLVLAVGPAVGALSGIPSGRLADRLGALPVLRLGLVQAALGLIGLAVLPRLFGASGYVVALILLTPAFQLFLTGNNTLVLLDAPEDQRGRLAGLLGLSRNLGLMTGASAMPAVFVAFLGRAEVAQAPATHVAQAFSLTFVLAAGLILVALGLAALSGEPSPRQQRAAAK